jgi:Type III flagellar switch regulator (C-ring) FliN C-term
VTASVRAIRLVGAPVLPVLHEIAATALASWAEEWLACAAPDAMSDLAVAAVEPADAPVTGPASHWAGGQGELWFDESSDNERRFGLAVAGSALLDDAAGVDDWVAAALVRAKAERNRALCGALTGVAIKPAAARPVARLPSALFALGSGAIRIRCLRIGLDVVTDAEVALRAQAPSPSSSRSPLPRLTPLEGVAASTTTRLVASLGTLDLDVSTTLDLRCGDVLRLPRRLDEGIDVTCGGVPVSRAQLGELDGRKGIQLRSSQKFEG